MKKIISWILIIALLLVNISPVYAENGNGKSATPLDENYNTKITLTLNKSEPTKKNIDVVFVVDKDITSNNMGESLVDKAYSFIESVNNDENVTAHIALVAYGFGSETLLPLTNTSEITSKEALASAVSGVTISTTGADLQNGLKRAKEILDNSTSETEAKDRHVVLLTDGASFTYDSDNGVASSAIYRLSATGMMSVGNMDSNGELGSDRETKTVQYYTQTNDYALAFGKLLEEKATIAERAKKGFPFSGWYSSSDIATINDLYYQDKVIVLSSGFNDLETYPYTSLEMGTVMAASEMQNIKNANYGIHTIGYLYKEAFDDNGNMESRLLGLPPLCFLNWTKNVGSSYVNNSKTLSTEVLGDILDQIKEEMLAEENVTSYLVDEMGFGELSTGDQYNFDLVNDINKIVIYEDNQPLNKEQISENVYGFGKDTSLAEGYKYIFRYYPNGIDSLTTNECFKLSINSKISNTVRVEYNEVLTNESQEILEDIPGEEIMITGTSAILYSSDGTQTTFNNPTVEVMNDMPMDGELNPQTEDKVITYVSVMILSVIGLSLILKKVL